MVKRRALWLLVALAAAWACSGADRNLRLDSDAGGIGGVSGGGAVVGDSSTGGASGVDAGGTAGSEAGGTAGTGGITLGPEHTWKKGDAAMDLGSTTNRFCFLTAIGGSFTSSSDVGVTSGGGAWKLSGTSSSDVNARARCVSGNAGDGLQTSSFFSWASGAASTALGAFPGRACGITGISGAFATPSDAVRAYVQNSTEWFLDGNGNVSASAHCLISSSLTVSPPTTWKEAQGPQKLTSVPNSACLFAHVGGLLGGSGDSLEIYSQGSDWWIVGGTQNPGIGSGHCASWP